MKSTTQAVKPVPALQVAVLRRRMMGASRRKLRLEQKQKELAQKIKAKGEYVAVNKQNTFMAYSQAQLITAKADLQMNKIALQSTTTDLKVAKKAFTAAVSSNKASKKKSHQTRVAAIKLEPKIPELVQRTIAELSKARENGSKDAVDGLIAFSQSGSKKDFTASFDVIVPALDKKLYDEICEEEGIIKGKVVSKVMSRLKEDEKSCAA